MLYKYRWCQLFLYCLATMTSMICWMSLTAVAGPLQKGYGAGSVAIAALGFTFMLIFIPLLFPSMWLIEAKGLRVGTLVGMILTCTGMWVKCLLNVSFTYCLIGQVIAASGQPFLLVSITKLAATWFGTDERVIATTIGTSC